MSTLPGAELPAGARPARPTGSGRRRRPSGEPPPLPRRRAASTRWYAVAVLGVLALESAMALAPFQRLVTGVDLAVLRAVARLRTGVLTTVFRGIDAAGTQWTVKVLGWSTIAVLLATRRFRHLVCYLAVILVVVVATSELAVQVGRMRPVGVAVIGHWRGYSHPSVPVAVWAAVVVAAVHTLVPAGRWRRPARWTASLSIGLFALARLYLAVDHPSDVAAALAIGAALPAVVLREVAPVEAFPVTYRRRTRAHLDIAGPREVAIRDALRQQLGLSVTGIEPFGLAGSAGSTPLRIAVAATGGPTTVFGKLYAINHLRSDRSYKLSRMVLYGRLEDEKPFSTVRRLAEYEDHLLRLLRDGGVPVPEPFGFVEITPEREYLTVMSFLDGAQELDRRELSVDEIDQGLAIVRRLWRVGVAHRDIKPSNLVVVEGRVVLLDVAFATARPTPWREAVDLANMMLTLALGSDAETVYARAVRTFSPDDVAEAFAASRGVTVPSQLRLRLREDGRDLLARFRSLAPDREPLRIQLWGVRRVLVTVTVLGLVAAGLVLLYAYTRLTGLL